MVKRSTALSLFSLFLSNRSVSAWEQCGGQGWNGPANVCRSGWSCIYVNSDYSECHPAAVSFLPRGSRTEQTSSISSTDSGALPTGTSTIKLNTLARSSGLKYFGSATDNPELTDDAYVKILNDSTMFGQITPGNSLKWDATEPSRGVFTFTNGDAVVNRALSNKQLLRGHNCVWYQQLPSWVTNTAWDNATLLSVVQEHCSAVVGYYKGKAYSWDVINEPFNDDGTFRTSIFFNTTGTAYIAAALRAARSADPKTKLYINDYNLEYGGSKINAMAALAKDLLSQGVPLDGIGFQGHLIVGSVPSSSDLQTNFKMFTDMGLEVAITELDIRMNLPETSELREQQENDYATVVGACKAVDGCVGVTIWDYTDKYSWIPGVFSGQGAALPWDANLIKKPAYDGIISGLKPAGRCEVCL